ncbi:MAG TPA: methyltransferase [Spirochaetia bacterium]|nr:methyltransferase [Spirochaetia bacterium]
MNRGTKVAQNDPADDNAVNPATIMRHVYGVFPSFAMLAAMKLDVFTPLKDGPMEVKDIADSLGVEEEKLTPLLYSLVAADLLEIENNRFSNTAEADKYLVRGRPDYIGGLSGFYANLWQAALKTAESIRTGQPQAKLDWATLPEAELLGYFRRQFPSSVGAGRELADRLDFSRFQHLLDAGGGTGGVSISICAKFPSIRATVADLPAVVRLAERFIAEAGMSGRINILATDLCLSPPEGRYDVAIIRALIQTLPKEQAQMALKCIGQAMVPGGKLFIIGCVLANSRLGPAASLAFSLVFLNAYDNGRSYTEQEYAEMLESAGFTGITVEPEAFLDGYGFITAEKK